MTPLVPIAMFGWPLVAIGLFKRRTPQEAAALTIIVGFLLLPMATYKLPGLPLYDKFTSISIGLLLGGVISGQATKYPLRFNRNDLLMMLLCIVVPFASSLSNGLGFYDGLSGAVSKILGWGIIFWTGRRYFGTPPSLRVLTRTMLVGGLIYFPLVLFEVRMSPQLSNIFYGFFPHSFAQTFRYSGWRPIIFMQHGLMVALWMAVAATIAFWLWMAREIPKLWKISIAVVSIALIGATVLCKSANGWSFLALGIGGCLYYRKAGSTSIFRLLLLIIPLYIAARILNIISVEWVQSLAGRLFDLERIDSLTWRLTQEDLFGARAMQRALFGWGGYNRGWPVDPITGAQLIQMVDSLWVIYFSTNGLLGLFSVFGAIGLGPWLVLGCFKRGTGKKKAAGEPYAIDAIVLSLVVGFFLFDSLLNAMVSPIYILCSGALVSYYEHRQRASENAFPQAATTE